MSARVRIDADALAANYALFQRNARPGTAGAVVKADGYGLGAAEVARTLARAGCSDFFVATAAESLVLRAALPAARIWVFEGALEETAGELLSADATPILNHSGQLEIWRRQGAGRPAAVHVDTGMERLGFAWQGDPGELAGVEISLLLTHLACADEPDHPLNARQLSRLEPWRRALPTVPLSVGNSAAILSGMAGGLGRPGIGLYGANPYLRGPNPMRTVATFEARILQMREIAAGATVGYGATFTAAAPRTLAVIGAGYADGIPRLLSNRGQVAIGGVRCPVVGRVSMDLTVIDATGVEARVGDWVEVFGSTISVDEVAAWADTMAYEVLTGLAQRACREWLVPASRR